MQAAAAPGAAQAQPWSIADEWSALMKLAVPIAAAQAGQAMMGLVDVSVVGRVGKTQLAAVGMANSIYFTIAVVGLGLMMGLDPLASQALGRGEKVQARRLLWQGGWLALFASVALASLGLFAPWILRALHLPAETAALALECVGVRMVGLPFMLVYAASRSYLQATGNTRPMVVSMVLANVLNFALNQLVVLGRFGLPSYGAVGSSWSSTLATVVQFGILLYSISASDPVRLPAGAWKPVRADIWTAITVGAPIGLQMGAEVGVFALVALLAGSLGDAQLAAHQVALTLASFTFCVAIGVGNAGSVRVGYAVGQSDRAAARRSGLVALAAGAGVMAVAALAFVGLPGLLVGLLTDQPEVAQLAIPLLWVAAVFQVFDGLQGVGAGVLRGAGDTRFSFVANVLGHYLVGLPIAVLLGLRGPLGLVGLWWGLCAGLMAVALALVVRFHVLTLRPITAIAGPAPSH
jgi:MATE family multidrug resistance protein